MIKFSPKFVPKGPNHNIPALVQIMAWRRQAFLVVVSPFVIFLNVYIYIMG